MCREDKACGPCSKTQAAVPWVTIRQTTGGVAIWGPISVEQVSEDDKLIEMAAIEAELPKLITRGRFTVQHRDMIAGEILPEVTVNPHDAPEGPARALLESMGGRLPTAVLTVTEPIQQAFPHLNVGDRVAFAGGRLYADDEATRSITREVLDGKLDSFSISGVATKTITQTHCDPRGCRPVTRVTGLNLSATTLASTREEAGAWTAKARNAGARLMVVQQSEDNHLTKKKEKPAPTPTTMRIEGNELRVGDRSTAVSTPPARVLQADDTPPAAPAAAEDESAAMKALNDIARRLESVETAVAEMKGAPTRADAPDLVAENAPDEAAPDAADAPPAEVAPEDGNATEARAATFDELKDAGTGASESDDSPSPSKEEEDESMTEKKDEKKEKVEQATTPPAPKPAEGEPLTLVLQALEKLDARVAAIEQAKTNTPAAQKDERVAGPSVASTPAPSAPSDNQPQAGVVSIQQAALTGNPLALREAFNRLQGGSLQ